MTLVKVGDRQTLVDGSGTDYLNCLNELSLVPAHPLVLCCTGISHC